MPYQNRVTPWGDIIAVADRGMFMGNRGCLHNAQGRLGKKYWARKPWIICQLAFKDRKRTVMSQGQYTELFFLDEATALGAGHRPCATCRRADYDRFKMMWLAANRAKLPDRKAGIADIDKVLHKERLTAEGGKQVWYSRLNLLPNGTFIQLNNTEEAWLVQSNVLLQWTPAGYSKRISKESGRQVAVLTPKSIVRVLAEGYHPVIHSSSQSVIDDAAETDTQKSQTVGMHDMREATSNNVSVSQSPEAKREITGSNFYRLRKTPGGKALYAYFAAILEVTGMATGVIFPLKRFIKNFSGHERAGRIRRVEGGYQLTRVGMDYFSDRYRTGNPQHVERTDVEAMMHLILSGNEEEWERA